MRPRAPAVPLPERRSAVFEPGVWHFALQVGIFAALGALYALSGLYGRAHGAAAVANAEHLIRLERALHLDWERGVQRSTLTGPTALRTLADQTYFLCQFVISTIALVWLYARHPARYVRVRDALVAANLVALATLFVLPVAPPRLVPGGGYVDTLSQHAVSLHSSLVDALNNPNAAMPSLHASYAVVLGVTGAAVCRRLVVRLAWALYPVLVCFSIVATGNHFVLDAAGGVLALAATPAVRRARTARQARNGSTRPGTTDVATASASSSGTSSTR